MRIFVAVLVGATIGYLLCANVHLPNYEIRIEALEEEMGMNLRSDLGISVVEEEEV
jgi:hypothetical protein